MLGSPTAQAVCACTRQYTSAARFVYTCTMTQACTLLLVCCCLRSKFFKSQRKSIEIWSIWIHFQYTAVQSFNAHTNTHIQTQRMREIYTPDIIQGMYPPPPSAGVRMSSRVLFESTCVFFRSARVHLVCIAMMFFSFRVKCLLTSIFLSLPALTYHSICWLESVREWPQTAVGCFRCAQVTLASNEFKMYSPRKGHKLSCCIYCWSGICESTYPHVYN